MAEQFKYVQELLSTASGTQGTLLIERQIYDTLIEEVDKILLPRSLAALYFGPNQIPGSSIDLNLENPNTMDVRLIAEGAEVALDNPEYTNTNVKPLKYGVGIRITRELMEDSKFNLLDHAIRTAAKRLAENEQSLVITALDGAANTVSGGAALTIANITRAAQHLDDADYTPSDIIIGNEALQDLRQIDTFAEADKFGNREMMEKGIVGRIYGLNIFRASTNAGMTTTSSYVIDRREAYVIAEKRPVTVENFDLPTHDMSAATVTQRIAVALRRSSAVAKITTS